MLLEAMFRGEFYPAETVIPREPTYRELQKASNDLLETLKVRLKGEDFQLVEQLLERRIDLAFVNLPEGGLPAGLEFAKLGEDRYSLAVSRLHPLARAGTVSLRDLRGEKFIFHQTGQVAAQLCLEACRRAGFEPEIVCRSSSPTTGLYMVRGGLGVAFLPSEEFKSHAVDGVVELKLKEPIRKEVGVAWRKDAASPLLEEAIRFCRAWNR